MMMMMMMMMMVTMTVMMIKRLSGSQNLQSQLNLWQLLGGSIGRSG